MAKQMILYRGILKSCNYCCSYCPFSKHKSTDQEQNQDKVQWMKFCRSIELCDCSHQTGAVMVVPYGEALVHPWYWEGLGLLSSLEGMEAVGAQTNLSFLCKEALSLFDRAGGRRKSLRLWATFHPEMVSVSRFVSQCREILKEGIQLCAGAVGVPENLDVIRHLREKLPSEIYLWINRMDGLKRPYTDEEKGALGAIDPWFSDGLTYKKSNPDQCQNRLFVEGDGSIRLCNISHISKLNWYEFFNSAFTDSLACGRSVCSCYLAYGGRKDYEHGFIFGRYPLFRIPWKPDGFFLDLDGTLIPEGSTAPSGKTLKELQRLSKECLLFLSTSLPFKEAVKKCHGFYHLFSGGVFSGGAHILLQAGEKREIFYALDPLVLSIVTEHMELFGKTRLLVYETPQDIYKITLMKPTGKTWNDNTVLQLKSLLYGHSFRCFIEKNCLQIVAPHGDKGHGVKALCDMAGIDPEKTVAAGNSKEDIAMFSICGYGIAASGSGKKVQEAADMILKECF